MIRKMEIENFFSFKDSSSISFLVNENAPKSKNYSLGLEGKERISKVVSIFGANGAGKSNLLLAIKFFRWLILDSFGEKPDEEIWFHPYLLKKELNENTSLSIEFEIKKKIYRYNIDLSRERVLREELHCLDLSKEKIRRKYKLLYQRSYEPKKKSYSIKSSSEIGIKGGVAELAKNRGNATLLSAGVFTNHKDFKEIKDYWKSVRTKMRGIGDSPYPLEYHVFRSTRFYSKNQKFKKSMEDMMSRTDLGLVGLDIEKIQIPESNSSYDKEKSRDFYMPFGRHIGENKEEFRLPFQWESGGTKQIYVLLSTLLPVLDSGGIAVVDEMEADLHPEVIPALLKLFYTKKTNPKKAQLLFTCHSSEVLKHLDKYQMLVVEKNEEGASNVKRVDEMSGVRSDDNLFSKYISGALGGRPKVGDLTRGL